MSEPATALVLDVLKESADRLAACGIESPRTAAELLLSRLLNCKRLELYLKHDVVLAEKFVAAMRRGTDRVAAHEPVQYVLGRVEFMGRPFKVDRRALIPRPETEMLVEAARQRLDAAGSAPSGRPVVADVGTGSGCIAISLALERPGGVYVGFDVSEDAVALARENAVALGVGDRVKFLAGNWAEYLKPQSLDMVVANLPYVPTPEYEGLPRHIREYEPRLALDGGPDGLGVITPAMEDAAVLLKPGGWLCLEIGAGQGDPVRSLLEEGGFDDIAVERDHAGHDRLATARVPPGEL